MFFQIAFDRFEGDDKQYAADNHCIPECGITQVAGFHGTGAADSRTRFSGRSRLIVRAGFYGIIGFIGFIGYNGINGFTGFLVNLTDKNQNSAVVGAAIGTGYSEIYLILKYIICSIMVTKCFGGV